MDDYTISIGFTVTVKARKKVLKESEDEAMQIAKQKMDEIVEDLRRHCVDYEISLSVGPLVVY